MAFWWRLIFEVNGFFSRSRATRRTFPAATAGVGTRSSKPSSTGSRRIIFLLLGTGPPPLPGSEHPEVASSLNNLAVLLKATNRLAEAEPLLRRALAIDEKSYGSEHPDVARDLNNLAELLKATRRLAEAEPLLQRSRAILFDFGRRTGYEHPHLQGAIANYSALLRVLGKSDAEIQDAINGLRANPV